MPIPSDEFDRYSSRYRQFKIRNTSRTSTPQPLVRTKHIRRNVHCDSASAASTRKQPPSISPDVDSTYVSYVQWRHYLVVPNSVRKFKVRYAGVDNNRPFRSCDTIISGNINMLPYPRSPSTVASRANGNLGKFASKLKQRQQSAPKVDEKKTIEDLLNSRIIGAESNMAAYRECKEGLERRNQRIVDVVMPMIKKSWKRFFVGEAGVRNVEPVRSKSAKVFSGLADNLRKGRKREDREYLIGWYDDVAIEE